MEKLILLVRTTLYDDSYGTSERGIKVCKSVEKAKEVVLAEFNERFGTYFCNSVEEVVEAVLKDDPDFEIGCYNDEGDFAPHWEENCIGDSYEIIEIDTKFTGWQ